MADNYLLRGMQGIGSPTQQQNTSVSLTEEEKKKNK